jgi:hypothetical protein
MKSVEKTNFSYIKIRREGYNFSFLLKMFYTPLQWLPQKAIVLQQIYLDHIQLSGYHFQKYIENNSMGLYRVGSSSMFG